MLFSQLLEYNRKLYTKCGGETIPRPSSKKRTLRISLDQYEVFLKNKKRSGTIRPASYSP